MALETITAANAPTARTSVREKMLNLFATPGDVFEQVFSEPPNLASWLLPTLLVCLTQVLLLHALAPKEQTEEVIRQILVAGTISAAGAQKLAGSWRLISSLTICLCAFSGTFWSAFVLWFMGRIFLKTRFSFLKALEVAGLSGGILVLGAIVTVLLLGLSDDPAVRPALSLLAPKSVSGARLRAVLDSMNLFHLWAATLLALGLCKLSRASFRESAFWVFGYWLLARLAIILLA
jgi:hypothetical protein